MPSKFSGGKELRKHWMLDSEMHFLNHGSFGACPRVVLQVQQELRNRMEERPINFLVRELPTLIRQSADKLGEFLGTDGHDLAFIENATAAVNAVIRSYPWQAGDEILLSAHAYYAVKNAARFVARQFGLTVREFSFAFPMQDDANLLTAFESSITPKTRMAILDHVSSPLAIVYPLEKMLAICRQHGIKTLIDGAHVPGMLPLNIEQVGADWYVGNCHKWLFAPKGCAFIWAHPQQRDFLQPVVISLRMDEGFPLNFDWVGTRDASAWLAIDSALQFYKEMGGTDIPEKLHIFAITMARKLAQRWSIELPAPEAMFAAMVTLPLPLKQASTQDEANLLRDQLWQQHKIEVPLFILDDGQLWCRISAQLYNTEDDYERLAAAIVEMA